MEKATIKNVGLAWQQVQENQKAAMAKKLAKAAASSEKGKAAVTLSKAPFPIPQKEAADLDKSNADKAIQHDCATHVEHAEWGKGHPISEQHTIVETAPGVGYVTHYDVMFEHGVEKNVAVEDLDILAEMSHGHKKKKTEAVKEMSSKEKMKKGLYNSKMDPVDKKELKGTHADRKDGDIDNDGDEDKSDKYLHKRRKAITKNMKKEGEVEMNPTKKKDKASIQNADTMESTLPPVYARIMEARKHDDKANPGSPAGEGMSPMAKKAKADMEAGAKMDDTEEKGHDDASKAGRAGPRAKARSGDNMKGDKSVINPVKK